MSDIFFSHSVVQLIKLLFHVQLLLGGNPVPVLNIDNANPEDPNAHGNGTMGPIRKAELIHK
jgi:hypothetical protein